MQPRPTDTGTIGPVNVHEFGPPDGVPVLALHGVTGHARRWRVLADRLPHVRFVAVDLRGHGRSPWTPPWTFEQHVADALAVLDARGLRRVAVLGHSFGGAVAIHLARAAPERVDRLVLLDPALGLDPGDALEHARTACADESYPDRAAALAFQAGEWAGVAAELVAEEVDAHLALGGDGRWRFRYTPPAIVTAWSEMARPAAVPPAGTETLLLPAGRAEFVRPEWVAATRTALGDALTVVDIDAGHMLFLERPADVATPIGRFLHG